MASDKDLAVARAAGLAAIAEACPDEIAAAIALARVQRDALAAIPLDPAEQA